MRQHRGWVTFLLWKGRKAHERERNTNGKKKKAGILQTFPSANLIFLDEAVYSRCTQSPLPQEENMPKAKSWNIALHRGERERESVPRANALIISTAFHIHSRPNLQTLSSAEPLWAWRCCERTAEGVSQHAAGRPSLSDYLPLFQRGSAPVSMTTWSLFCSVGLDIQSVAGEGCRGATQQMHFSQQDALLLPGAAWELVRRWWGSPWFVFFAAFFVSSTPAIPISVTTCLPCLLG